MCLLKLKEFEHDNFGYKVFRVRIADELTSPFFNYTFASIGYWDISETPEVYTDDGDLYYGGFHIYKTFEGAKDLLDYLNKIMGGYVHHVIRKVEFKDVLATGVEYDKLCTHEEEVIVAKEMKICA